jgi:ubiquinone/menaquinone biosynthesis C-methylase UbiE
VDELELLIDFHVDAERQGPGSPADLELAARLAGIDSGRLAASGPDIIDIGCGTGASAIALARDFNATVTAVDLFPQFLARLEQQASALGLSNRITTVEADMTDLPFPDASFDVVWSEGAAYNMGFASAVTAWKRLLRPGGVMAISEITWLTSNRPAEIDDYWSREYPEIDTAATKIAILQENGLSLRGYFILSESAWKEHYYQPMEQRLDDFLARHEGNSIASEIVDAERREIELFGTYRDHYGYGFYVAALDTD